MKCAEQDYIEIACLYKLRVELLTKNDSRIEGVARDTKYNAHKQECIVIETIKGLESVPLDTIMAMRALETNPHFTLLTFFS